MRKSIYQTHIRTKTPSLLNNKYLAGQNYRLYFVHGTEVECQIAFVPIISRYYWRKLIKSFVWGSRAPITRFSSF